MRRSVFKFLAAAAVAAAVASPAMAKDTRSVNVKPPTTSSLPAVVSPCDLGLPTPDATACAGYFAGNLLNGSSTDVANQQAAIDSLPGTFTWDGNWTGLVNAGRTLSGPGDLQNGNQLNFGTTMFGLTIVGAHFGNVDGPAGNVSVFWLFDFGTTGANFVTLDNPQGWSNAALYTTGSPPPPPTVPEPATWAMMLVGFGAAGAAMRRNRRKTAMLAQIA